MPTLTSLQFFCPLHWIDQRRLVIEPYRQRTLAQALDARDEDGSPRTNLAVVGRAKKNFETTDLILAALYRLLAWDSPGGNQCYLLANDEGQAADDLDLAVKIIKANPVLHRAVKITAKEITRKDGRGFALILPAKDIAGTHGKTYLFCGFDEIHAYRDWKLLEALQLDPTRPDALMYITSYASVYDRRGSPLHDLCERGWAGTDPRMVFEWHSGTRCTDPMCDGLPPEEKANPSWRTWRNRRYLPQQESRLPAHQYRRLHLNLGGQPEGSAFTADMVMGGIDIGVPVRLWEPGRTYQAFADMSGGSNEDAALAVGTTDPDGVAVICRVLDQGQRPPFNPLDAVRRFAGVCKEYGICHVTGDKYSGETFISAFGEQGIGYTVAGMSKSQLYQVLEPRLNAGRVRLPDVPQVEQQLLGLVWRGGKIDHVPGEKDDHANAAAGLVEVLLGGADHWLPEEPFSFGGRPPIPPEPAASGPYRSPFLVTGPPQCLDDADGALNRGRVDWSKSNNRPSVAGGRLMTITIPAVEIFGVGRHPGQGGSGADHVYTLEDLRNMVRAAKQIGFTPPLKLGHLSDNDTTRLLKRESLPAFGWLKNLRVHGGKLLADLTEVPKRVAELIKAGAYKKLSAEIYTNFRQGSRTWPYVLKAAALLGSEVPAVGSLADVEALYSIPAIEGQGDLRTYVGEITVTPLSGTGTRGSPQPGGWWTGEETGDGNATGDNGFGDRKAKGQVHYRLSEEPTSRCGTCSFFHGDSAPGNVGCCSLVDGDIAADAVCDLYEICEAYDFEDGNGDGAEVAVHQTLPEPELKAPGNTGAVAAPEVAQKEYTEMDPQQFVIGECWKYQAEHGGTFEEAMKAFQRLHPDDFARYITQATVNPREAIAGVPVRTYAVGASVIMNIPGTDIRIEPRGAGPDRWVVYAGDDEEDEIASFNTQAAALAYVNGLVQTGSRTHSRSAAYARRYQVEPSAPGVTIDEAIRRDFSPERLGAISRLTNKAIAIRQRYHEARRSGAYGPHPSLTEPAALMSWPEAVRAATASLGTDAAIAGPAGIAAVMRADPAAAG